MIEDVVSLCLDEMESHGAPVDLVETFAALVPALVLCDMLGVPREDRVRFEELTEVLIAGTRTTPAEKLSSITGFYDYVRQVLAEKRTQPGGDLLSKLVASAELNDNELSGTTLFLFVAGHKTVSINLALSVLFLLSDRERWNAARADLSAIDRTVKSCSADLAQSPP